MKSERVLHENIAAISAQMHADPKLMQKFYNKHGEELEGFVGIWYLAIDAAKAFGKAERELKWKSGEDYNWIDATDNFARAILKEMEDFSGADLIGFAKRSIQEARF